MYKCYLFGELMPETPSKLTVKIKGKNETMTLLNDGEINFLKLPGLTDITLSLVFPMLSGENPPDYYLSLFEEAKTKRKTTQFIMTRTSPSGKLLFDTNMKVSVEDYSIVENAKNGLDVSIDVKLKQYKDFGTKTVTMKNTESDNSTSTTSSSANSTQDTAIKAEDSVTIQSGASYGGACESLRGIKVPSPYIGVSYTVSEIRTINNEEEALISELYSWVPVKYLSKNGTKTDSQTTGTAVVTTVRSDSTAPSAKTHTVVLGETLWGLAAKYYGSGAQYSKIYEANKGKMSDPNVLSVGQVLTIP